MKRNPKSKRIQDSDSGKFLPEDVAEGLVPFGYNDSKDDSGANKWLLIGAAIVILGIAHTQEMLPVFF